MKEYDVYDTGLNWVITESRKGIPVAGVIAEKGVGTFSECIDAIDGRGIVKPYVNRMRLADVIRICRDDSRHVSHVKVEGEIISDERDAVADMDIELKRFMS